MKIEVGQQVWYVPADLRDLRRSEFRTVKKIGRKWVVCDVHQRFDIETGRGDGGTYSSPGRYWETKEAWEAEVRRIEAWITLTKIVACHIPPEGLSVQSIIAATTLLLN